MRLKAVIADDEPLSREKIKALLESEPDFEVVALCSNGRQVVEAVQRLHPDVLFLDVKMPHWDGLEALAQIPAARLPKVIFTTAHDKYAVEAFERNAVDYLLKPFTPERFRKALVRVRSTIANEQAGKLRHKVKRILNELATEPAPAPVERLVFKAKGRIAFIDVNEIAWITAEGNYVRLHVGKESYLYRETMANMLSKLDPVRFLRVHRSTIVNTDFVKEIHPWVSDSELMVVMKDGTQLAISRGCLKALLRMIEIGRRGDAGQTEFPIE